MLMVRMRTLAGSLTSLESQGWTVYHNSTLPITEELLGMHDLFMVPTALFGFGTAPFSPEEQAAVGTFLANGGGLWVFHDYNSQVAGINSLSITYGVSFQNDQVRDPTNNEGQSFWPTIHMLTSHPTVQGITSYGYYAGCCLQVVVPALVIGQRDDDTFSSSCVSFPPTLATYDSGVGRAVFSGDITPLHPTYYPGALRAEEELLLQNIANWLAHIPTTATANTSWGSIKALYR